jgi:AraC-like DNA-binding protein
VLSRPPGPRLSPFVQVLWASEAPTTPSTPASLAAVRERVLPTGAAHLVFRLSGPPLRLYESVDDPIGHTVGHAILGGPRERFYLRDVSEPTISVGAQLWPGALALLAGVPAHTLHDRHVAVGEVWGEAESERIRSRLHALPTAALRLAAFEQILTARLPKESALHPAIAHALRAIARQTEITRIVESTGYSHRHFLDLFTQAVGLTPKRFARICRFQEALRGLETEAPLTTVTYDAGYGDQPHFAREFRAISGLTPSAYRRLSPANANHVPLTSTIDKTEPPARAKLGS